MKDLTRVVDEDTTAEFVGRVVSQFNDTIFSKELCDLSIRRTLEKTAFYFKGGCLFFGSKAFSLLEEDLLLSIFHEMVHALNCKRGVKDVGRNDYHNKAFLNQALSRGTFVIRHRSRGWCLLSLDFPRNVVSPNCVLEPSSLALKVCKEVFSQLSKELIWSDFYSGRLQVSAGKDSYKYVCSCPPPYNSIRSGRSPSGSLPPKIKCMTCGTMFVCESERYGSLGR